MSTSSPRIAILTRAGYSYHLQVGWGFFDALESHPDTLNWRPVLFFCKEANEQVMRAQMAEIQREGYDLIISVGAMRTAIAKSYLAEHNLAIPQIFVGVTDPVGMGILPSMHPTTNITGVHRAAAPPHFAINALHKIKPHMRHILIPYFKHADGGQLEEKLLAEQAFMAERGVAVSLLPTTNVRSLPKDLEQRLTEVDSLICPEGSFLESFTTQLVGLCNRYNVTLFSHNIEGKTAGAAITFSQDLSTIGHAVFTQAYKVLQENQQLKEIPVTLIPNQRELAINIEAAEQQGLQDIDPTLMLLLHNSVFVKENRDANREKENS